MRLANRFLALSVFSVSLALLGCGASEVAVPEQTAEQKQKMEEYNKAINEAEAKGIDPATIPPPK